MSPERHLDPDALADVLAGEASLGAEEHIAGCAQCRAALDELRTAQTQVTAELGALPGVPMPDDIAARLHQALRDDAAPAAGSATVTPFPTAASRTSSRAMRWLPAAAAAVVLLAGAGYGISRLGNNAGDSASSSAAGAKAAGPNLDIARNDSGTDYTDRASLSAAVPDLLKGQRALTDSVTTEAAPTANATVPQRGAGVLAQPAPDQLARLRGNAGLADCLIALLPPDDPSVQPLAIDYASFRGKPAMVVLLPGTAANKLDVFVVGPGCSQANDSLLFYTSVDKP